MTRRDFLAASSLTAACASPPAERERPNVLFIYTDEHSAWTLGAYGGTLIETPHLDLIAQDGAVFNNYFVNSAVCTPSRGCLLTGRYPHAHGAYTNNLELNRDEVTLAHLFKASGYETGMAGKWHLDGEPKPGWMTADRAMGFDDVQWMYNRGHWKRIVEQPEGWPQNRGNARFGNEDHRPDQPDGRPDVDYAVDAPGDFFTDWITDKAIEFVERDRDRPFFYFLSIPDPHSPFSVSEPYASMFDPTEMPVPETLYEEDLPDWAELAREGHVKRDRVERFDDPRRAELLRERLALYCGMVKCIDDNVGRLLAALEGAGELDNTLIVFTSDHGNYLGEHGLYFKNQLYETAHRVAFLMRWPPAIPAGTVVDECVSSVDVQSTVCALADISPSGREQGLDFSRLARGEADPDWPNEAYLHHSSLERAGVFTPEWEFALVKDADGILFDRRNDPQQVDNLFEDPAHAEVRKRLSARVIEHHRQVESPAVAWLVQEG